MHRFDSKKIVVCALADVTDITTNNNASALVSVLQPDLVPQTPAKIQACNHYKMAIDDIEAPFDGLSHARVQQIEELCEFAIDWHAGERANDPAHGDMIVHCYAGISRSTAAAFVILCALNPTVSETTIARYLRQNAPSANPNRLIVSLGDRVLRRNGQMSKALQSIGRPSVAAYASPPVTLHSNLSQPLTGIDSSPAAA